MESKDVYISPVTGARFEALPDTVTDLFAVMDDMSRQLSDTFLASGDTYIGQVSCPVRRGEETVGMILVNFSYLKLPIRAQDP